MTCRWDRTTETHLLREHTPDCTNPGCPGCKPCTHDAGDPVRHCRARRRCTSHLGWTEHVCPTCLGKIRTNLTRITTAMALMPTEVEETGQPDRSAAAAYVPGATANPAAWRYRMLWNRENGGWTEDADERDPWQMLGLRERMIREDLGHDHRLVSNTLSGTCGYLAWVLTDLARDPDQTTTLSDLLSETARLADHLEAVLRDGKAPERGIPCPQCVAEQEATKKALEASDIPEADWPKLKDAPRLVRHYGHWCTRDGCQKIHYLDTSGDTWRCPDQPNNPRHTWTHQAYEDRLTARKTRKVKTA